MPQSLAIGAFVFGAVLVLLALAGGGFKLFGAEVSGAAGRAARAISFVLGLLLLAVGLTSELGRERTPPAPTPTPETSAPARPATADGGRQPETPPPAPEPPPTPPAATNLSGGWWDGNGTQYQIEQSGGAFRFAAFNPATGLRSEGTGTLVGLNLRTSFRTSYGATGRAEGVVSEDGRQIVGTCWDTTYGTYPFFLRR